MGMELGCFRVICSFCDYADFNAKKVNVLDKEFAQYVPEKYNPVFRD